MIDLGEKEHSIKSVEIDTLKQFMSKSNQTISSLVNTFDYLNDDSVIIKNGKQEPIQADILEGCLNQTKKQCDRDEDDELENIDLEKVECQMNGFWHNKGVNSFVKFDNFLTSLSDANDPEVTNKELDYFLSKKSYSPSFSRNKDKEIEFENMNSEKIDLKITGPNFQHHPGFLDDEHENYNDKKKLLITLNLTKCECEPEVDSTQMTSDYVEQFCLDPTHDYSKYSASTRYDFNKKFNLINQ